LSDLLVVAQTEPLPIFWHHKALASDEDAQNQGVCESLSRLSGHNPPQVDSTVRTVPALKIGSPELLFEFADSSFFAGAISPDGQRFLFTRSSEEEPLLRLVYVLNWVDALERIFAGTSD
jgi:hypothetical protein